MPGRQKEVFFAAEHCSSQLVAQLRAGRVREPRALPEKEAQRREGLQAPDRGPQRCARRVLRQIPVPMIRRGAEAAPHAEFAHLLLPQKNCLSNERRLRKMIEYKMKTKKNMKNTNISTSTGTKNETFREKYTGTLCR